ncbi:MAG: hypothetical protein IH600_00630 [Bacteroidetes bacterium]|nr:hypothetical protein [Bacteroidota bacterium]
MRNTIFLPLFVLLTCSALAQTADSGIPISLHQQFSAPAIPFDEAIEQPGAPDATATDVRQWQPYDGGTIILQSALGAAGGVLFAYAGWGMGSQKGGFSGFIDGIATGYLMGSIIGVPVGTYLGGTLMGGDGALWATLVGGGVGCALGVVASQVEDPSVGTPLFIIGTIAPPILGYHLSAGGERTSIPPSPAMGNSANGHRVITPPMSKPFRQGADPTVPRPDVSFTLLRVPL